MTKGYWQHPSPTVWPPPHTYRQLRALAGKCCRARDTGGTCCGGILWSESSQRRRNRGSGLAVLCDLLWVGCSLAQTGSAVEPPGSGLVPSPPPGPVQMMADGLPSAGEQVEGTLDLGHCQRHQAGLGKPDLLEQARSSCLVRSRSTTALPVRPTSAGITAIREQAVRPGCPDAPTRGSCGSVRH